MQFIARVFKPRRSHRTHCILLLFSFVISLSAASQSKPETRPYTRLNTFGILAAYSNDSSHMLLGIAENRKLLNIGVAYNRRLWSNRLVNWQYSAELLPVALESDPLQVTVTTLTYTNPPLTFATTSTMPTQAACHNYSGSGSIPNGGPSYTFVASCSRRWTIGEAFSPIGFQWNFTPRRRLQPFLVGHGGYMYSSQTIPVTNSGNFNFTFDLGVGIELYRTRTQSVRAEYRYHHISNDWTASSNPGIDSGLFQVSYTFGR